MRADEFIELMGSKSYTYGDVQFFLDMVHLYESAYDKSIADFDLDTVNTMLCTLSPKNSLEEKRLPVLLYEYLKFIEDKPKYKKKEIVASISSYFPKEKDILSEEEFYKKVESLDNPVDKVILACPYCGIGGTGMDELLEIRDRDIYYSKNQVLVYKKTIDAQNKIIVDLPEEVTKWMLECMQTLKYNSITFSKSDLLIKLREGSKQDNRQRWLTSRLIAINEELETRYSFTTLRKNGIVNAFRKATHKYKVDLETLLTMEAGQKIMKQYSYPEQRKTILIKKYKQYMD